METIDFAEIPHISDENLQRYGVTREKFDLMDDLMRFFLARFCLLPRDKQEIMLEYMHLDQKA